jgi:hypothetical protein
MTINIASRATILQNTAYGKILQVVRATDGITRSTTSTATVDVTGMSVTITPQKSDSAILIVATSVLTFQWSVGDEGRGSVLITDSSNNTISGTGGRFFGTVNLTGTGTRELETTSVLIGYATPGTTSAVTYKMRFFVVSANTTFSVRNGDVTGQMFAIEISA